MIALREEPKRNRLQRALSNDERVGQYQSILDGKIDWCEERTVLDDYPGMTSFEEAEYFWIYENRFPQDKDRVGITVQPTIGAEEDLDDDRIPNYADPDRDGDRVPDNADTNDLLSQTSING
ncbi:MAG: hypothetical protein Q8O99_01500 [bacterium]|nr:hypothetical protein [bacterium]